MQSQLDSVISAAELAHPGQSGFRLLAEGHEAFAFRERSAVQAGRSLDVQTYIWHADLTGLFLAHRLLEAADRGVQVRLLLDDIDARAKNAGLGALAAHPNIQVRLFNPFASREGSLRFLGEGMVRFAQINRRMHNKTWIADNRLAIAGGRNLGDEYFSAQDEVNFVDLDIAMMGPVVRDASASFDRYWNAPTAYPMEVLDPKTVTPASLEKARAVLAAHAKDAVESRYADALRSDDAILKLARGDIPMEWSDRYHFIADDPSKVTTDGKDPSRSLVLALIDPVLTLARTDMTIISPYFVPGDSATRRLAEAARSGVSVRILTNSLAANDVAAVHGGYSRYRKDLIKGGVQMWELKPLDSGKTRSSFLGSSGASLHTKAFTVDHRTLFVGSYNLDPRSTWLNCEQGVLVDSAVLTEQLNNIFGIQTAGERAWHVSMDGKDLRWSDGRRVEDGDPDASLGRRFQAWLARMLGIDEQL